MDYQNLAYPSGLSNLGRRYVLINWSSGSDLSFTILHLRLESLLVVDSIQSFRHHPWLI